MLIQKIAPLQKWGKDILLLIIRLWIANIFLRSGILKLSPWDATLSLFENDYHLPFLPPNVAAIMGTAAEITGGALVLLGILTPLGAFILLGVTATIEFFVYPGTTDHYHWMMLLVVLIFFGAGRISLDEIITKRLISPRPHPNNFPSN